MIIISTSECCKQTMIIINKYYIFAKLIKKTYRLAMLKKFSIKKKLSHIYKEDKIIIALIDEENILHNQKYTCTQQV